MSKLPLFVTRYSLSPKNAIGVQTNYLLEQHAEWLHFYWSGKELVARDPRSVRLENAVFGRVSFFQQRSAVVRWLEKLSFGWWVNDQLRPGRADRILEKYQNRVSVIYAAPLELRDARRIRELIEMFKTPFVLHLWDFLDSRIATSQDLCWMIRNAEKVFCLSEPMLEETRKLRPDADMLLFTRKSSRTYAEPRGDRSLRIVMIGNIYSYRQGLDLLHKAVQGLSLKGIKVSVCYLGPKKSLRSLDSQVASLLEPLGFVQGDENRDRELSKSHVGFLPGPLADPEVDMRSRYSIPSRILDFLATGLPVVGTIKPSSATGVFCERLGLGQYCFFQSVADIERGLTQLLSQSEWSAAAALSRQAFDLLSLESQPNKLKQAMRSAAAVGCTLP